MALTGETSGYYADFEPLSALVKVCERGFFHDGTFSSFRGRDHGAPVHRDDADLAARGLQPEPRPGRQPRRRRPARAEHLDEDQLVCAALLTLAGPFTPMLFQGEEWAAIHAVPVLHLPPRARARHGHRRGTAARVRADGLGPRRGARIRRTRRPSSARSWTGRSREQEPHARVLAAYQRLIELRRSLPALTDPSFASISCTADEERRVFTLRRGDLLVVVNFGDEPAELFVDGDLDLLFRTPSRPDARRRPAPAAPARRGPARTVRNHRRRDPHPRIAGRVPCCPCCVGAVRVRSPTTGRRRPSRPSPLRPRRPPPHRRPRLLRPPRGPADATTDRSPARRRHPAELAGQAGAAAEQADGFGEVRPTPRELDPRRFTLPDQLPPAARAPASPRG